MNEDRLRAALRPERAPREREVEERAWAIVRAAYGRRPAPARRPLRPRPALVLAAALVLLAGLVLTPAGAKVVDLVDEVIHPGARNAEPALTSLPAPGRLLVESPRGPWIVQADGSKRLLGSYRQATWSPNGLFVAVTRGSALTAVVGDPATSGQAAGTVHWSLAQRRVVRDPAWAPSGLRVAYLAGSSLHVVEGDGEGDRVLDPRVASTPPRWLPDPQRNVLAYVDADHRVVARDAETGRALWRSARFAGRVTALDWSAGGNRLLVASTSFLVVLGPTGTPVWKAPTDGSVVAAAFSPAGDRIALLSHAAIGRSKLVLVRLGGTGERTLIAKPGRFTDLAWSPSGAWLLVAWRDADQWLFVRPSDGRLEAVSNIAEQFAPGSSAPAGFPGLGDWCCAPAG